MTNDTSRKATRTAQEAATRKDGGTNGKDARTRLVAVYGTLMNGEKNARWRQDIPTKVEGTMWGHLYDTGYGFPAFVPAEHGEKGATQVSCEILECTPEQIAHMDVLEGYPNLYRREVVRIESRCGWDGKAMVYVMNHLPEGAKEIVTEEIQNWGKVADWRAYRKGTRA